MIFFFILVGMNILGIFTNKTDISDTFKMVLEISGSLKQF